MGGCGLSCNSDVKGVVDAWHLPANPHGLCVSGVLRLENQITYMR